MDRSNSQYQDVLDDQMLAEQAYNDFTARARADRAVADTNEFRITRRWYLAASRALALAAKLQALDGSTSGNNHQPKS
jgi:hypothetical protein